MDLPVLSDEEITKQGLKILGSSASIPVSKEIEGGYNLPVLSDEEIQSQGLRILDSLPPTDRLANSSLELPNLKQSLDTLGQATSNTFNMLPGSQGVKQIYDKLPDFRSNKPPTTLTDRLTVKTLVNRPNEQVQALKDLGYNAELRGSSVYVDGKEFDPNTVFSLQEIGSEIGENLNLPVEAAGSTNFVTAGLTSGGLGLARETAKNKLFPSLEVNTAEALKEGALGAAGQVGASIAGAGFKKVFGMPKTIKNLAKKGINAKETIIDASGKVRKIDDETFGFLDAILGDEANARAVGAKAKHLKVFNNEPITVQIQNLKELSPEFDTIIKNMSVKGKRDGLINLVERKSEELASFYNQYGSEVNVKVGDIFDTEDYTKMLAKLADKNTPESVVTTINEIRRSTLEDVAKVVLPKNEYGMLTGSVKPSRVLDPNGNVIEASFSPKMSTEALESKLKDYDFNMGSLWEKMKFLDDEAMFDAKIPDASRFKISTNRQLGNSFRKSIKKGIERASIPDADKAQFLNTKDIIHNLIPVTEMFDNFASNKVGTINTTSLLWSKIGRPLRQGLEFAGKIATKPEGRNIVGGTLGKFKGVMDKINVPGLSNDMIPNIIDAGAYTGKLSRIGVSKEGAMKAELDSEIIKPFVPPAQEINPMQQEINPMQQEINPMQQEINHIPQTPRPPIDIEDIHKLIKQAETPKLPRSPELINSKPEYLEALGEALQPDTFNILQDALESKDSFKTRIAMSLVLAEAPDYFEKSVTGNRSEMMVGGNYVITDPMEAEVYRQTILSKEDLGELDSEFVSKQLTTLNNPRDMRIFPLPGQDFSAPTAPVEPVSKLQSIREKLGSINQQREYDY